MKQKQKLLYLQDCSLSVQQPSVHHHLLQGQVEVAFPSVLQILQKLLPLAPLLRTLLSQ